MWLEGFLGRLVTVGIVRTFETFVGPERLIRLIRAPTPFRSLASWMCEEEGCFVVRYLPVPSGIECLGVTGPFELETSTQNFMAVRGSPAPNRGLCAFLLFHAPPASWKTGAATNAQQSMMS